MSGLPHGADRAAVALVADAEEEHRRVARRVQLLLDAAQGVQLRLRFVAALPGQLVHEDRQVGAVGLVAGRGRDAVEAADQVRGDLRVLLALLVRQAVPPLLALGGALVGRHVLAEVHAGRAAHVGGVQADVLQGGLGDVEALLRLQAGEGPGVPGVDLAGGAQGSGDAVGDGLGLRLVRVERQEAREAALGAAEGRRLEGETGAAADGAAGGLLRRAGQVGDLGGGVADGAVLVDGEALGGGVGERVPQLRLRLGEVGGEAVERRPDEAALAVQVLEVAAEALEPAEGRLRRLALLRLAELRGHGPVDPGPVGSTPGARRRPPP
ncbi:hypothetical protein GCM10010282_25930 [Streptomyces roseolus]|nr:hypothetical protein GCM10010282_25930 [Streptomyces roseolus]